MGVRTSVDGKISIYELSYNPSIQKSPPEQFWGAFLLYLLLSAVLFSYKYKAFSGFFAAARSVNTD
jgi:hypothetical protein